MKICSVYDYIKVSLISESLNKIQGHYVFQMIMLLIGGDQF